ncbi:MAG TPA: leucyl/phenylalanyl-tRNA--protein transferase [Casimicrobiaceae bacterium]|nr:leucyl/phenylalanyl-tRNA--protein transferase [Casimicrobiaceae bacterium]
MIPWLSADDPFPPVERALDEPNGLLAAGGDLSPQRLLAAYRHGVFPWYSAGQPILWWSPDPRMVLYVDEFRISRSLRKTVRAGRFDVRADTAFADVVENCARTPRPGQYGTWITPAIIDAYVALHRLGYAHSIESWQDGELVGGLYGVCLGRVFFGESMFAWRNDASKVAMVTLVDLLRRAAVPLVDCQQQTAHLESLGARPISRGDFAAELSKLIGWPASAAMFHVKQSDLVRTSDQIE